ncbi:MAG: hypothetical protein SOY07_10400 [Bacteroidales bacterium]|nr:hypothetical protein [Bacteroidales bacterium]
MSISVKYSAALDAKRAELMGYVKDQLAQIVIPSAPKAVPRKDSAAQSGKVDMALGVAGVAGLLVGFIAEIKAVAVAGAAAVVGAVAMRMRNKGSKPAEPAQPQVKLYEVRSNVYNALSATHRYVFEQWGNALLENKRSLKAEIADLPIDEKMKNAAIQSILTTSVFDLSMMKVSSSLDEFDRNKDLDGFKRYLNTFETLCGEALDSAVAEQKRTYSSLDSILG